jgi:ATP-dependent Clp protease ATP-binding subunit ClpA
MRSYSRYSHHARRALSHARALVNRYRHPQVDTGHVLVGVMLTDGSMGCKVLQEMGLSAARAEPHLRTLYPVLDLPNVDDTDTLDHMLTLAESESEWLGHHYIGTEHLLLGITRTNVGNASMLLRLLNTSSEQLRRRVRRSLHEGVSELDLQFVKRSARLSELSRRVISAAEQMATSEEHTDSGTAGMGHLLLVLLLESRSPMSALLRTSGLDEARLREGLSSRDPALLVSIEGILNQALDPVERVGNPSYYTGTDQILFTLALDPEGAAVLHAYGVKVAQLLRRLKPDLR